MIVKLKRVNNKVHYEALNDENNSVHLDGAPSIGGEGKGFRPMQLVLAALASCTLMDLGGIIEKQRMTLTDISVEADGKRAEGQVPSPFTDINLHYTLIGDLQEEKVKKALDLAVYKYCSVGAMIEKSAKITYSFDIVPA